MNSILSAKEIAAEYERTRGSDNFLDFWRRLDVGAAFDGSFEVIKASQIALFAFVQCAPREVWN